MAQCLTTPRGIELRSPRSALEETERLSSRPDAEAAGDASRSVRQQERQQERYEQRINFVETWGVGMQRKQSVVAKPPTIMPHLLKGEASVANSNPRRQLRKSVDFKPLTTMGSYLQASERQCTKQYAVPRISSGILPSTSGLSSEHYQATSPSLQPSNRRFILPSAGRPEEDLDVYSRAPTTTTEPFRRWSTGTGRLQTAQDQRWSASLKPDAGLPRSLDPAQFARDLSARFVVGSWRNC